MLDIWSPYYKQDNVPINNDLEIKFNQEENYYEPILINQDYTGISNEWEKYNQTKPKTFEPFTMGNISNCMDILPYPWLKQHKHEKIKCYCRIEANKRDIIFNKEQPNISSNDFVGGHFYVCINNSEKNDCGFFQLVEPSNNIDLQEFIIDEDLIGYVDQLNEQEINETEKSS
jgi:hypothetical protein